MEVGDRRWREILDAHQAMVRRELGRFRGREIDTAGDGFLASFDGPARAIRCALAAVEGARRLGLEIRAGLHTGECEHPNQLGRQIGQAFGLSLGVAVLGRDGLALHVAKLTEPLTERLREGRGERRRHGPEVAEPAPGRAGFDRVFRAI